jgi:hypothetical protein
MASSDDLAIVAFGVALLSFGMLIGWIAASFYFRPQLSLERYLEVETDETGVIKQLVR